MAALLNPLMSEDRWEISDTPARCAFAADTRDMGMLDDVFVPEATCDLGCAGEPHRRDAVKALFLQLLETDDATQRSMTTSLVSATPGRALARTSGHWNGNRPAPDRIEIASGTDASGPATKGAR
jgi:hypothetical protein